MSEKEKDHQRENMGCQDKYEERLRAEDSAGDRDTPNSPEKEESALKEITDLLDEDGDLEVVRKTPLPEAETEYCSRHKVCPIILTKGGEVLEEDEQGDTYTSIIKIGQSESICCCSIKPFHAMILIALWVKISLKMYIYKLGIPCPVFRNPTYLENHNFFECWHSATSGKIHT